MFRMNTSIIGLIQYKIRVIQFNLHIPIYINKLDAKIKNYPD